MKPDPSGYQLLAILITLIFSAFFSGMEIAFVSCNKLAVELEKKQGSFSARIISSFFRKPSHFIATMLVGNNIFLVIYGIITAQVLAPILIHTGIENEVYILVFQTVISTLVVLVTAEFLPKTILSINPNRSLYIFSVPLVVIYYLLWIPTFFIMIIANVLLKKILKVEIKENTTMFGRVDLDHYVKEMTMDNDAYEKLDNEIQIFQNALDFSSVKARECLIPRNEIIALEANDSLSNLKQRFIETGLSKILIYRDNIDNIIGYVHSYELFKNPKSIKSILLPISIIPETTTADEILELLVKQKKRVAIVVDEFGGTAGMVTIEDVLEEIFGEIEDEHDSENQIERKINDSTYVFSARLEIDYLNEKYPFEFPQSDDYDTLAGYIINKLETIPKKNNKTTIDDFEFTFLDVTNNKINTVKMVWLIP